MSWSSIMGTGQALAPNATGAMGKDASLADFTKAVKQDIAVNNENRVDLPPAVPSAQMQPAQQISQQQYRPGAYPAAPAPPVITGFNL